MGTKAELMGWNRDVLDAMLADPKATMAQYTAPSSVVVPLEALRMLDAILKEGRDMKKTKGKGKGGKGSGY